MTSVDMAHALSQLAAELHVERSEAKVAQVAVDRAIKVFADADCASITTVGKKRHDLLAATSDRAAAAYQLQQQTDQGPCLEAAAEVGWIQSGDVPQDRRWPNWGPSVTELRIASLLTITLVAAGERVGALSLYSPRTDSFSQRNVADRGLLFGAHVARALSSARHVAGLEAALDTRHTIGVAQGMLRERFGLDLDQSFALLRRVSSRNNVRLADVCARIVETGQFPSEISRAPSRRSGRRAGSR